VIVDTWLTHIAGGLVIKKTPPREKQKKAKETAKRKGIMLSCPTAFSVSCSMFNFTNIPF
jgi:peroxiredoxin